MATFVDMIRVFTGVPFGAVGGIFALWIRDMPFSISAAIGFIAMSGVAVLDDMILVSYIRQLRRKGMRAGRSGATSGRYAIAAGAHDDARRQPGLCADGVLTGMGAEVQRPLATVVIGGVISAMVMSLFVVRVLYLVIRSPVKLVGNGQGEASGAAEPRSGREVVSV